MKILHKALEQELDQEVATSKRYNERVRVLSRIERLFASEKVQVNQKFVCKLPEFSQLQDAYQKQVYALNKKHKQVIERTHAEQIVSEKIAQMTKLKSYRSFWIANRNIDLFFPTVGSLYSRNMRQSEANKPYLMRGLAIEVDGPIHDNELKMRKDEAKSNLLKSLGIAHIVIQNTDVAHSMVQKLFKQLRDLDRLDTRAKRRVMRKVYVATLAYHASEQQMAQLYGESFSELVQQGRSLP